MKSKSIFTVKLMIAIILAISLISCASGKKQSAGFLNGYYQDLGPGPEGGVSKRWLKPGTDFAKYKKLMLDSVVFYFSDDSEDKGIDPEKMKDLSDAFNLAIVNAFKERYPIVADPGPDVIRLKIALTGVKQSKPVLSTVTSVMPIGLGINIIKKGTTGVWTGSGATSAEFMAIDSMSNTVIAVAQDEQTAGFVERFTRYGSAEDAFEFWAERMRMFMDNAHGMK